ncbi:MAG: hypothetical protein ACJ789_11050 [Thermomicrobiales bacterium]
MAWCIHDPRLDLTTDDVFALSAALSIAIQQMDERDRPRFQRLAAKLAAILALLVQTVPA